MNHPQLVMQPKDVSIFIGTVSCGNVGNLKQITWVPGTYLVIWIALSSSDHSGKGCAGWKAPQGVRQGCSGLYPLRSWKPPTVKRDCIAFLGSFFWCLTPVMMKKFLLICSVDLSLFQLMPVVFHPCPTVKTLPPSSGWPPLRHWRMMFRHPKTTSSPGWPTPSPSASPHRASASPPNHCGGPTLNSLELINRYLVPLKCLWGSVLFWQIENETFKQSSSFYGSSQRLGRCIQLSQMVSDTHEWDIHFGPTSSLN